MTQKLDQEPEASVFDTKPPSDEFRAELVDNLPALKRFAIVLCRDEPACDDLVQATCERALGRWQQFHPGTRLRGWLFSIMHSIWKNKLRRHHNQRNAHDKLRHESTATDGEREALGKIELSEVLSALKGLSHDQATAITLVSLNGLSYREAAQILDIPQGTLESRIARGRIALGKLLEGKPLASEQTRDAGDVRFEQKARRLT